MTLVESLNRSVNNVPFFSICIPQYNRFDHLLMSLDAIGSQQFRGFEVCIADDLSSENGMDRVVNYLNKSGIAFAYLLNSRNLRYDGNIRTAMSLALGEYIILQGNDDCLKSPTSLEFLRKVLLDQGRPAVAIPNFEDYVSGKITKRIRSTRLLGRGPEVAAAYFRNYSFVSGVTMERSKTTVLATDKWDGSEMYQMYIGSKIVSQGGALLGIAESLYRKDITIKGQNVDSFKNKVAGYSGSIWSLSLPMRKLLALVIDAVSEDLTPSAHRKIGFRIFCSLYLFTYPFWLFEYRRLGSTRYALATFISLRPSITLTGVEIGFIRRNFANLIYLAVGLVGLLTPTSIFFSLMPTLYRLRSVNQARSN